MEWSRERHTRPNGRKAIGPALRTVPVICGTHATEQYSTAEEKREREEETEEEERDKIA